jgi:hypothetical protein
VRFAREMLCLGAACGLLWSAPQATAQIAPGLRAPETVADGIEQAHAMACFLAVAGRPFPGLNFDAPDLMGEGLRKADVGPDWLSASYPAVSGATLTTLTTGQSDVWIAFDAASARCIIAAQADDTAALREALAGELYAFGDWDRRRDRSAIGYHYRQRLAGLTFVSRFLEPATPANVIIVELTAS